jgi:hypothetical protein
MTFPLTTIRFDWLRKMPLEEFPRPLTLDPGADRIPDVTARAREDADVVPRDEVAGGGLRGGDGGVQGRGDIDTGTRVIGVAEAVEADHVCGAARAAHRDPGGVLDEDAIAEVAQLIA